MTTLQPRPADGDRRRAPDGAAQAEAVIDLTAISANTALLKEHAGSAALMAVVKADGYGHGAVATARAALDGGADMLGVATLDEAVALRGQGVDAPLVAWLWPPTAAVAPAVDASVQVGVSGVDNLAAVVAAASGSGRRPQIHLKVDTGLGRGGTILADFPALAEAAAAAERAGTVEVVGVMSHLACADIPGDTSVLAQVAAFDSALDFARSVGLDPPYQHLANTAAALVWPQARFTVVRCGIGLYGLPPVPGFPGFRPAMTLRATVALIKRVAPGAGVGYGLTYHTNRETTLALVPIGYGDGLPRVAGNVGQVQIGDRRYTIAGRVAMDQVVIDCGDDDVHIGDDVLIFGPGDRGEPSATDWAEYCGTIDYEIVTRISSRVPRRYLHAH